MPGYVGMHFAIITVLDLHYYLWVSSTFALFNLLLLVFPRCLGLWMQH